MVGHSCPVEKMADSRDLDHRCEGGGGQAGRREMATGAEQMRRTRAYTYREGTEGGRGSVGPKGQWDNDS